MKHSVGAIAREKNVPVKLNEAERGRLTIELYAEKVGRLGVEFSATEVTHLAMEGSSDEIRGRTSEIHTMEISRFVAAEATKVEASLLATELGAGEVGRLAMKLGPTKGNARTKYEAAKLKETPLGKIEPSSLRTLSFAVSSIRALRRFSIPVGSFSREES